MRQFSRQFYPSIFFVIFLSLISSNYFLKKLQFLTKKYEFEHSVFSKVSSSYKKSYGMGLLLCLSKIVQIWLGFSQRCTFYVKNVAVKNMKKVLTVKNCALKKVRIIKIRFAFINLEFSSEASFRGVKNYPIPKIFVKLCLHSSLVVQSSFQIDEFFWQERVEKNRQIDWNFAL